MLFECSDLKSATDIFDKVASVLTQTYNCEWEDEVHASFKKYVQRCEDSSRSLKSLSERVDSICHHLNERNIDREKENSNKLNRAAEHLCQEARSLL